MINNSTYNKTNNHLSSSHTEHNKETQHMMLEIHILAWNMHTNVSPLDNWISNGNAKNKTKNKAAQIRFH
jgi:hypothetical protein